MAVPAGQFDDGLAREHATAHHHGARKAGAVPDQAEFLGAPGYVPRTARDTEHLRRAGGGAEAVGDRQGVAARGGGIDGGDGIGQSRGAGDGHAVLFPLVGAYRRAGDRKQHGGPGGKTQGGHRADTERRHPFQPGDRDDIAGYRAQMAVDPHVVAAHRGGVGGSHAEQRHRTAGHGQPALGAVGLGDFLPPLVVDGDALQVHRAVQAEGAPHGDRSALGLEQKVHRAIVPGHGGVAQSRDVDQLADGTVGVGKQGWGETVGGETVPDLASLTLAPAVNAAVGGQRVGGIGLCGDRHHRAGNPADLHRAAVVCGRTVSLLAETAVAPGKHQIVRSERQHMVRTGRQRDNLSAGEHPGRADGHRHVGICQGCIPQLTVGAVAPGVHQPVAAQSVAAPAGARIRGCDSHDVLARERACGKNGAGDVAGKSAPGAELACGVVAPAVDFPFGSHRQRTAPPRRHRHHRFACQRPARDRHGSGGIHGAAVANLAAGIPAPGVRLAVPARGKHMGAACGKRTKKSAGRNLEGQQGRG